VVAGDSAGTVVVVGAAVAVGAAAVVGNVKCGVGASHWKGRVGCYRQADAAGQKMAAVGSSEQDEHRIEVGANMIVAPVPVPVPASPNLLPEREDSIASSRLGAAAHAAAFVTDRRAAEPVPAPAAVKVDSSKADWGAQQPPSEGCCENALAANCTAT